MSSIDIDSALLGEKNNDKDERTSLRTRRSLAASNSTFESLAFDVSGFRDKLNNSESFAYGKHYDPEFWEDFGVVEYLECGLGPPDESTSEEREEALREVLADTDIHEGSGDVSDFLFHVARTKHGKIYIRVIRTFLLNRGKAKTRLVEIHIMFVTTLRVMSSKVE